MAKILVVDDSGMSRRTMRKILEPEGHQIIEASDGLTALELFFLEKPELTLLDLTMTGMYGIEVLERMIGMDPQTRVIVASADIQRVTRDMVEKAGARGFITKPFVVEEVLSIVNAVLGGE